MLHPYLRLIRFDRPIGSLLLLWPTLWALFVVGNGHPPLYSVIVFSLGVFLTRSAGCAINDYADIEFDKYVARTKSRPLAAGEITKKEALFICFGLSLTAFILAGVMLKLQTIYLSIPAFLIFITYPFTKRFLKVPQAYLGIAFSFGILMAFMELSGRLPLVAWLLFLANIFWVIGYDTIYALVDIEDDLKIGINTSAIFFGYRVVRVISVFYLGFSSIIALIAYLLHFGIFFWPLWLYVNYLLFHQVRMINQKNKSLYFKMFLLNNRIGFVVFTAILFGTYLR